MTPGSSILQLLQFLKSRNTTVTPDRQIMPELRFYKTLTHPLNGE